jgi:hypothetical protein
LQTFLGFQAIENPYLESNNSITERYPRLRRPSQSNSGIFNGYLKFRIRWNNHTGNREISCSVTPLSNGMALHHRMPVVPAYNQGDNIARLPQGFGSNAVIDETDRKLFRFCEYPGIKQLPHSNTCFDSHLRDLWRSYFATKIECLAGTELHCRLR